MQKIPARTAIRGCYITFEDNPFLVSPEESLMIEEDGLIVMEAGRITHCGPYADLAPTLDSTIPVTHYPNSIISAGFIDTHVHYPQMPAIASWGQQLLPWLEEYIFPTEARFNDSAYAEAIASAFLDELLRNGTTTAAVYCTVHAQSVDAFFRQSEKRGTRMIAGKVLMDRNAPDNLRDTAKSGYDDSTALIQRWHNNGRQLYAVTPRFAITSTPEQLEMAGDLLARHPSVFMQTHLAENMDEIKTVSSLFPDTTSYLDVYAQAGLVGARSIFGHGIYLQETDFQHCHHAGCTLAHCPTSNLFLGSGLFRLFDAIQPNRPVHVGLGTDIGAGTTLSMLGTMGEAYKVSLMAGGERLQAIQAFWLATAGAAQALKLDEKIGRIAPGMEADLCVMDPAATPILAQRTAHCQTVQDTLFPLIVLGDDRCIKATWVNGQPVYVRP
ncbi:guanine deaminase [Acetobacter aceti 1023]|nr:guanine deaminase [Acetobacter aceti 1023]